MSHHILHVFQHGAVLARERGFIVCRAQDESERRLPLDNIRAVVVAACGVTLTSGFLSGILEKDSIVLHCDEHYQPCGWTAPLARVVDLKAFQTQTVPATTAQRTALARNVARQDAEPDACARP